MSRNCYRSYFLAGAMLALVSWSAVWASDDGLCAEASFSDVNTTLHHAGEASCFTTYVPSAGLLVLEVDVANTALAEPWLEFHGSSCKVAGAVSQPPGYRQRFANSAVIEIQQAGEYHFCVAAQDPSQALDEYRVVNGFAPAAFNKTHEDEAEPEPDPLVYVPGCWEFLAGGVFKTHEDEAEPEPDPLVCVPASFAGSVFKTHEDEAEPEPDPLVCVPASFAGGVFKTHEDEAEPEPDPLVYVSCQTRDMALLGHICQQNRTDDHSSAFRCATPLLLGTEVEAEIRDPWGNDRDLFTFAVEEMMRVRIETIGGSDTLGGLYDQNGYRLRVDDDGGDETNFRIVKTLSPGRYYVRVEGGYDTEGAYRLRVENLSSTE